MFMRRKQELCLGSAHRLGAIALSALLVFGGVPVPALGEVAEVGSDGSRTEEAVSVDDVGLANDGAPAGLDGVAVVDGAGDGLADDASGIEEVVSGVDGEDAEDVPEEPTIESGDSDVAAVLEENEAVVPDAGVEQVDGTAESAKAAGEGIEAQSNDDERTLKGAATKSTTPSVSYRVHVQTYGDQAQKKDGAMAGTSGEAKRLEAIWIKLASKPVSGGITYRTHVQTYGWQDWVKDGAKSGTSGEAKRLEAIQIKLTGKMEEQYDVYYRVHAQKVGWMAWAKNGKSAGTSGMAWRLEGIQVVIVKKGKAAPGTVKGIESVTALAHISNPGITYRTHVQTYGWQDWVKNGKMAGTSGEAKRLEALEAKLASSKVGGSVRYRTHVQTYGWQSWVTNGAMSGTSGESKRLEAIQIKLTGEVSKYFDVWYRTHVQTYGWLGWAKNGEKSGTAKLAKRMEALQVKLVPKGADAPGSTSNSFVETDPTLSGDAELDGYITEFIKQTGTGYAGLRRAYEIISSYPYSQGNRWPGANWEQWSIPYAKEMYLNKTGNCYRYASLMCWTARRLGYDAKVVPGWIPGRINPHCDHGWVEILLDGEVYVIDAEMNGDDGYPEYNWFMIKYADAYLRYYDLDDNRILR